MIYTQINPGQFKDKILTHVPIISIDGNTVTVNVGEKEHPMIHEHFITDIELFLDNKSIAKKELLPNQPPEAVFQLETLGKLKARATCNLHGVWES